MIILDTDHLSVLVSTGSVSAQHLVSRMDQVDEEFAITIISVEEELRGWLSLIHSRKSFDEQLPAYERLGRMIDFLGDWTILPFDETAANTARELTARKVRLGAMDLKIASTCLAHGATLLTRNSVDFERVEGLQIENWLDD